MNPRPPCEPQGFHPPTPPGRTAGLIHPPVWVSGVTPLVGKKHSLKAILDFTNYIRGTDHRLGSHGQMVTISAFQNFKMLAEDPSSILGESTGTWEIPG